MEGSLMHMVLPSLYDLKDLEGIGAHNMWAIEMFVTFFGWLKEAQEIDDGEFQGIEMVVNFYWTIGLVEWVEYSMLSTES